MKVVVDTNIIFSILLSHSSKLRDMLWNRKYTFYSSNFVFVEIFKHKEKIMKFTKVPEATVYEYLHEILKRINFVNIEIISDKNLKKPTSCAGTSTKWMCPGWHWLWNSTHYCGQEIFQLFCLRA